MKSLSLFFGLLLLMTALAYTQGNQPTNYGAQNQTGTTDPTGNQNRQAGTITEGSGNTAATNTPVGTDPTFSPANRNPFNDSNYRQGTPGTSAAGRPLNATDPRITQGNPETLGTAMPSQNVFIGGSPTPGIGASTGQTGPTGLPVTAPAGNPGPEGNPAVQNTAPTTGGVGTGGSGASGIPGSISNSGTHGIEGSGH